MTRLLVVILALLAPHGVSGAELQAEPREILRRAKLAAAAIGGSESRFAVLREIASTQSGAGDLSGASVTLRETREIVMDFRDENPRNEAMIEIARYQARAGDIEGALKTAGLVWREGYRDSAMRVIVEAQLEKGHMQEAMNSAQRNGTTHLTVRLMTQIAVAQAKAGDRAGATRTLEQARQVAAAVAQVWEKSQSSQFIATAQSKIGDLRGAQQTAENIQHPDWKEFALEGVAVAQAEAGDVPAAFKTAEGIRNDQRKALTLRAIGKVQAQKGNVQGALQTAAAIQNNLARAWVLRDVAAVQARAKEIKTALKTAASIQEDFIRAEGLREIAAIQLTSGDMPGALQSVATIPRIGKSLALRELAAAQAKLGDVQSALRTAGSIQDDSQAWQPWAFRDIAVAQAAAGDLQGAIRTVDMIQDVRFEYVLSGSAARWVVGAQAKRGDVRAALEWADNQKSAARKALALLGVAEGILERVSGVKRQDNICRQALDWEWVSPFIVC